MYLPGQELQKLTPDSNSGLLRVDKLFEMVAKGSGDPRFAHFEAQMTKDLELPWRMFKYGRRGGEHGTACRPVRHPWRR